MTPAARLTENEITELKEWINRSNPALVPFDLSIVGRLLAAHDRLPKVEEAGQLVLSAFARVDPLTQNQMDALTVLGDTLRRTAGGAK